MSYAAADARQEMLEGIAEAISDINLALTALGDAYDQLDDRTAERLEDRLFRPLQAAYGRARHTHDDFAARHGLAALEPGQAPQLPVSTGRELVESAAEAAGRADDALVELQDSMMPVEVGDAELRAGLAEVRAQLEDVSRRAREFMRRFGR
jgi:hypothetical protein